MSTGGPPAWTAGSGELRPALVSAAAHGTHLPGAWGSLDQEKVPGCPLLSPPRAGPPSGHSSCGSIHVPADATLLDQTSCGVCLETAGPAWAVAANLPRTCWGGRGDTPPPSPKTPPCPLAGLCSCHRPLVRAGPCIPCPATLSPYPESSGHAPGGRTHGLGHQHCFGTFQAGSLLGMTSLLTPHTPTWGPQSFLGWTGLVSRGLAWPV